MSTHKDHSGGSACYFTENESCMIRELAGDWLNEKVYKDESASTTDQLDQICPSLLCSASEKALPTVTNPTPYSNDYSKFQRMEAEMKAKEEAELEMAKREEDLRQAQERCPLDHEHGIVPSTAEGYCHVRPRVC